MSDTLVEQSRFRRVLLRAILLPLLVMLLLTAILIWQIVRLLDASLQVDHTDQVISQAHEALNLLVDMETGQRGYLVSGNPLFLEPYDRATAAFPAAFAALQQLVADNPSQGQRLTTIRSLEQQWADNARAEITLRKQGQNYQAAFDRAGGKQLMDRLRAEFAAFVQNEETLRRQRVEAVRLSTRSGLAIALGFALAVGCLLALTNRRWLVMLSRSYERSLEVSRDQTVLLRQQAATLKASEENLATTLHSIGDAVIATDTEGRITFLNPIAETLTGWSQGEAEGKPLSEVFVILNEETRQTVESPVTRFLREGVVVGLANHTVLIGRDGSETPIDDSGAPIRDEAGNLSGVVLVFHDITERKRSEEALQESEEQFRATFEQAAVGIAQVGADYKWQRVNQKFCDILGYTREELLERTIEQLNHPEDLNADLPYVHQLLAGEIPHYSLVKRNLRKDGFVVWVNLTVSLVRQPSGEPKYFISVIEDITERKRLENQLLEAQKLESVGRLAGGVAHDFNNLLTVILGYAELLEEDEALDDATRQSVQNITHAAEKASNLTGQLLAFARRQVIEPRNIVLNDLILSLDKMLRRLIGEDIELVMLPEDDLHAVKVDPGQFEQILLNLVVNARDAIPEGGKITLETHNASLDAEYARQHEGVIPGEYVLLAVSDTGTGMQDEIRLHIFEPFFTKEKGRGTGLGLATVYGIVKQAGGHIWLYSELGAGTTFKIYLPRALAPADTLSEAALPVVLSGGSETILLVEDEPSVRALAAQTLRDHGYTVLEAMHGEEALRVASAHETQIALLLTDVVMPQMSGSELAQRLQAQYPQLKVLYASGYTENTIVHHGVLEPGIAFLSKPFTPTQLTRKVREILDSDRNDNG